MWSANVDSTWFVLQTSAAAALRPFTPLLRRQLFQAANKSIVGVLSRPLLLQEAGVSGAGGGVSGAAI